ncbi:unnamed protein product [Ostreobium quekettii]|uniref:Ankyrin repeat domain-containing protein n=1 Tax=Ostreobium quekettii TaxID=121088 RepID=A0A8S1IZA6_9CHLO|nr:unnamed protein product [Ostreobium quekettii]
MQSDSDADDVFYDVEEDVEDEEDQFVDARLDGEGDAEHPGGDDGDDDVPIWVLDAEDAESLDYTVTHCSFPLHMAAYDGDHSVMKSLIATASREQLVEKDPHGNTALHIAVMRQNRVAVEALLGVGVPSKIRNERGWTALDEAISMKNRALVTLLYKYGVQEIKDELKGAKQQLLKTLSGMPDYSMELTWQLGSPVLGFLLRKWAPYDTYTIWKQGTKIRVDGTLMGIDKSSARILPEWKRGKFSLLFDGIKTPAQLCLVDHTREMYLDVTEEKQRRKQAGEFDVDAVISEGAGRTKLRAVNFRFKPVKGWAGGVLSEKIEGWTTKVYEASGKMMAVTCVKQDWRIPRLATFEEYLAINMPQDTSMELPVNPTSLNGAPNGGKGQKAQAKPKKFTGRCWMAENFPMSLQQLLPLLDVVGHANKHLGMAARFMRKYGDMKMFPVRIQVPLMWTVYLLVSFKKFRLSRQRPDEKWFQIPAGFTKVSLDDFTSDSYSVGRNTSVTSEVGDEELGAQIDFG